MMFSQAWKQLLKFTKWNHPYSSIFSLLLSKMPGKHLVFSLIPLSYIKQAIVALLRCSILISCQLGKWHTEYYLQWHTEHYHSWILTWSGHNTGSCNLSFAESGIKPRSRHATNLWGCLFTKQLWAHCAFYPGLQGILELLVPQEPTTSGYQWAECHAELLQTFQALCSKNKNHPQFGNSPNIHNKD